MCLSLYSAKKGTTTATKRVPHDVLWAAAGLLAQSAVSTKHVFVCIPWKNAMQRLVCAAGAVGCRSSVCFFG